MSRDVRNTAFTAVALLAILTGYCLADKDTATVSGKVTDEAGTPLGGVRWQISAIEEWHEGGWEIVFYTGDPPVNITGDDGRFEVTFHGKVRYDLQFDKWGFGPAFLYQVSAESPELHVVMKKGSLVQGRVTRSSTKGPCNEATMVELRLPNPRGVWYKKSTLVGPDGDFRFFACPPPQPPMDCKTQCKQQPIKWQVVCAGEMVQIDVAEGKPVDEVLFEIDVKATTRPAEPAVDTEGR